MRENNNLNEHIIEQFEAGTSGLSWQRRSHLFLGMTWTTKLNGWNQLLWLELHLPICMNLKPPLFGTSMTLWLPGCPNRQGPFELHFCIGQDTSARRAWFWGDSDLPARSLWWCFWFLCVCWVWWDILCWNWGIPARHDTLWTVAWCKWSMRTLLHTQVGRLKDILSCRPSHNQPSHNLL
jgi:hypothetical protein